MNDTNRDAIQMSAILIASLNCRTEGEIIRATDKVCVMLACEGRAPEIDEVRNEMCRRFLPESPSEAEQADRAERLCPEM
jgi:hypothetical protein